MDQIKDQACMLIHQTVKQKTNLTQTLKNGFKINCIALCIMNDVYYLFNFAVSILHIAQ